MRLATSFASPQRRKVRVSKSLRWRSSGCSRKWLISVGIMPGA